MRALRCTKGRIHTISVFMGFRSGPCRSTLTHAESKSPTHVLASEHCSGRKTSFFATFLPAVRMFVNATSRLTGFWFVISHVFYAVSELGTHPFAFLCPPALKNGKDRRKRKKRRERENGRTRTRKKKKEKRNNKKQETTRNKKQRETTRNRRRKKRQENSVPESRQSHGQSYT